MTTTTIENQLNQITNPQSVINVELRGFIRDTVVRQIAFLGDMTQIHIMFAVVRDAHVSLVVDIDKLVNMFLELTHYFLVITALPYKMLPTINK